MKKVVFLRSNPIDPEPRIEKQARALARAGYQVLAVGWDRGGELPKEEKRDLFTIYRTGPRAAFGAGFRNLKALVWWQWDLFGWLWKNQDKYTHIHAADLDTVLPALALKYFAKKRVIYDIFDFFADSRKGPNIFRKVVRYIEVWAIGLADAVILVDQSRVAQISGARPKRLEFILNSPEDLQEYSTSPERLTDPKPSLRIAFVGILQEHRWLFEMLDLVEKHPDWQFDLAGFGGIEEPLKARVANIPNARLHGRISHFVAMRISAEADALFAIYDPVIPNHKYSSANKLFEAMMLGKPILVARDTGMDQIVEKYNLGFVVDYNSPQEVEQRLLQIASWDIPTKQAFAERVRSIYAEHFSWKIMSKRLVRLYEAL